MKFRKLVTFFLALCLTVSLFSVTASAAPVNVGHSPRWNIMLVVDNSGSLYSHTFTDRDGLRFEALNMLIDSLHNEGNYVGAVLFHSYYGNNPTDENMLEGITEIGIQEMNSIQDKNRLKQAIYDVPKCYTHSGPDTDIGTALLVAQQRLSEMDNGLPGAIFLFTDGIMELCYSSAEQKAYENLDTAVNNIRDEGIVMCGIYLNKDNRYMSTQVRDIVADCIGTKSANLGELYVEINDASDLAAATDAFLVCLDYILPNFVSDPLDPDIQGETVSFDRSFRIPGTGVEEANIRLRTANGEDLPRNMNVTITRPDGTRLTAGEAAAICSAGRTYQIYKLTRPESGTWNVHVTLPEGNNVEVYYDPILSYYIESGMEVTPAAEDLHVNSAVTINTYLAQDGVKLTDPASYREYTCILEMKNITTGEVKTQEITPDANYNYAVTLNLQEYGVFDVRTSFVCEEIAVSADRQTWDLMNHAPVSVDTVDFQALYGLFQGNEKMIDLTDAKYGISDMEDDIASLQFSIQGGDCDVSDMQISGAQLTLDASTCGNGSVIVNVSDTQGASTSITIHVSVESVTLKLILILLAVLLILVIILVIRIRRRNSVRTNGNCSITVWVPRGDTGDGQDISCEGLAPPGGKNNARKLSLYTMLMRDLDNKHGSRIKQACKDNGVEFSDYKTVVENIAADLKKATVESVLFKDKKTKKLSCDRLNFRYKNIRQSISSGGGISINVEGIQVTFGYSVKGKVFKTDDVFDWDNVPDSGLKTTAVESDWDSFDTKKDSFSNSGSMNSFEDDWEEPKPKIQSKPKKEAKKEASFDDWGFDSDDDSDTINF